MNQGSVRIAIAGAGSIGCYVGGALAAAGRNVVLLGRERIVDAVRSDGLRFSDHEGRDRKVGPREIDATADPAVALRDSDIVLVTAKSAATQEIAGLVAAHASPNAVVASLQNGMSNAELLRRALPQRTVLAGMVPFNVVQQAAPDQPFHVHRASSGKVLVEPGEEGLARLLDVDGLPAGEHRDIRAVQWGKLLLNLNNALVALSDRTLVEELSDRRWRRILAAMIGEGLATMKAAGIRPLAAAGPPPALIPHVLRLPDALFGLLARRMLAIDPKARASMWDDLVQRRPTEIGELQGAIVAMAQANGLTAPVNAEVMRLVRLAEDAGQGSPGLSPDAVSPA